jgi:hypothetical protein
VEISILIYLLFLVIVGWALPTFPPGYHHPIGNTNSNSLLNPQMPDYQRAYTPGGAIFLTLVTFNRRPIFYIALQPCKAWAGRLPPPMGVFEFAAVCKRWVLQRDWGCRCGGEEIAVEFEGEGLVVGK